MAMFVDQFSSFNTCKLFSEDPAYRKLLSESLRGFADGRLPGNLGDMPEVLNTGCVQRAACLPFYVGLFEQYHAEDSRLRLPWQTVCEAVPMPSICKFVDQWLLSSGAAKYCTTGVYTLFLAVKLMRMISCCSGRAGFLLHSRMLLRCVHLLRHIMAACPAHAHLATAAEVVHRLPALPARLPSPPWAGTWQLVQWRGLLHAVTSIGDFLWYPWRPGSQPAHLDYLTAVPSESAGSMRSVLYQKGKGWARYDARVGALLDMGAAGVVESLLRLTVRLAPLHEQAAPLNGRALLYAHTMLHHPRAWPRQETALGLLISVRKSFEVDWVGLPWDACATSATLPMALLTSIVRKEALLPEHTVAFAATQLLPVIQAATQRRLACHPCSSTLCRELLMMCSVLAASSAWPVLLNHRYLLTLAADMVHFLHDKGLSPCGHYMCELDMACVVAAACDLAMADAAFRASVSASGAGLGDSLTTIYHKAACQFPKDPEAQGLVTLMHCQLTRAEAAGLRAGVADLHFRKHMLVLLESVVGPLPDWRRTAFWRENSFARAYERVQPLQEREAWKGPLYPIPTPPAVLGRAAIERVRARSLLLAGQAGLCCNPRCTEVSGRHERSLRTLRCAGGCQHGRFCSRACQREAWAVHRLVCKEDAAAL